jgi:hypothetical protein
MDAVRHVERRHLLHDARHFAGLDVGDVDVDAAFEVHQLSAKRRRTKMAADVRQLALLVAEGGLDDQMSELHAPETFPERGIRARIAGVDPPAVVTAAIHGKPDGRHGVRGAEDFDLLPTQAQHVADRERHKFQDWLIGTRQAGEIRPDDAIEYVVAQRRECFRKRMHLDRRAAVGHAPPHHRVGKQRDRDHMVEMGVAENDVLDAAQRLERHVADAGAGIDQHVIVEPEGGRLAACRDGAGTPEHVNDHGSGIKSGDGMPAVRTVRPAGDGVARLSLAGEPVGA